MINISALLVKILLRGDAVLLCFGSFFLTIVLTGSFHGRTTRAAVQGNFLVMYMHCARDRQFVLFTLKVNVIKSTQGLQ